MKRFLLSLNYLKAFVAAGIAACLVTATGSALDRVNLVYEGDSLTVGYPGASDASYPAQLGTLLTAVGRAYPYSNRAASSETIVDMLASAETDAVDATYDAAVANIAVLWSGTNDLFHTSDSAATIYANLTTWVQGRQAAGFRVIVLTPMPSDHVGVPGDYETRRVALNALINANSAGADAVVNLDADSRLTDPADATYFADRLHLTTAGYAVVAALVQPAIVSSSGASG